MTPLSKRILIVFFASLALPLNESSAQTTAKEVEATPSLSAETLALNSELFQRDAEIQSSKNSVLAYNTGIKQFDINNYLIAEYFFSQAIKFDPYFAEAFLFLARIKMRESDFDQAEELAIQAIKYNPSLVPAYLDLFLICSRKSKTKEANEYLLEAARLDPETVSSTASRLITEQNDLYGAIFFFEKVHTIAPTNLLNALNYAKALMIAKRGVHAEKVLEIAYQANDFEEDHFSLLYSMYFSKLLKHRKYRSALLLASEKVPSSFYSQYLFKALSHFKLGDIESFEKNASLYFMHTQDDAPPSLVSWAENKLTSTISD